MKKEILKIIGSHSKVIFLSILLQIMSIFIATVIPYMNGKYVDLLNSQISVNELFKYALFIIFIGLLSILITYIFGILNAKIINIISFKIYLLFTKHIQRIPVLLYDKFSPTYLNQRITADTMALTKFIFETLIPVLLSVIKTLILFVFIYQVNPYIFFILILFIPIYTLLYIIFRKPLYEKSFTLKESQNIYFNKTNEYYSLNTEIKVHADFDNSILNINNSFNKFYMHTMQYIKTNLKYFSFDGFIELLFQSLILVYGGILVINSKISLGEYTVINVYFSVLLSSVKGFIKFGQTYQDAKSSINRLKEIYSIPIEANGENILENIEGINIIDLQFKYKIDFNNFLFKKVNMHLEQGGITTITGKNGGGKTTLIKLIIGLIQHNTEGNIYYNNYNLSQLNLYNLRHDQISVMLQNENVPNLTVYEFLFNKSYNHSSRQEVKNKILEYDLENIYITDTFNIIDHLSHNLKDLSEGEKQLILFFRTMIKNASFYILDEPTSNLTHEITIKIMNYLNNIKKNKIILIVSHSQEVFNFSDIIYNLDTLT